MERQTPKVDEGEKTGLLPSYSTTDPNVTDQPDYPSQLLIDNQNAIYEPESHSIQLNYETQPEKKVPATRKYKIISIAAGLLLFLVLITVIGNFIDFEKYISLSNSSSLQLENPSLQKLTTTKKKYQFEDMYNPKFRPNTKDWTWVKVDRSTHDGAYTYEDETGNIWLKYAGELWEESYLTGRVVITRKLIDSDDTSQFTGYTFSPDLKFVAVVNRVNKVWRHSYTAQYRIFDLGDLKKPPVIVSSDLTSLGSAHHREQYIQLFKWASEGHDIAFVFNNDVYVGYDNFTKVRRVSHDGSKDVINGIPDWVYEEEVFAANDAMWFSPTGKSLAYLKFDDSHVPDVQVPLYTNEAILKHANVLDRNPTSPLNDPENALEDLNGFADYPQYIKYKYPKAGYPNPTVSLRLYKLNSRSELEELEEPSTSIAIEVDVDHHQLDDVTIDKVALDSIKNPKTRIITDVVWLDDKTLLFRITNRVQDVILTCIADTNQLTAATTKLKAKVIRLEPAGVDWSKTKKGGLKGDGGWYQTDSHPITPINGNTNTKYKDYGLDGVGYIDKVVYDDHYHYALFYPADSNRPLRLLTSGNFDVESSLGVNADGRFYYLSRELDSTASHVFSVNLKGENKVHLSKESHPTLAKIRGNVTESAGWQATLDNLGHFEAALSSFHNYLFLSYLGPNIPYQLVLYREDLDRAKLLEANHNLQEFLTDYALPTISYKKLQIPGIKQPLDVMEILPPNFDPNANTKLSLLFRCYGGPESKLVTRNFNFNFHTWLVTNKTNLGVVIVDGRGTAYKSRAFATSVVKQLGKLEAQDQLAAVAKYGSYKWVDPNKIGLWGWSYGGYLTSKTLEADSNRLLQLAIAVAPVISWHFYDSVYTERYMKLPKTNKEGYQLSQVANLTNFHNRNFLLLHGNSDDNVHVQNSMQLLKRFETFRVKDKEFYTFPDNDHAINNYNANYQLYTRISAFVERSLAR